MRQRDTISPLIESPFPPSHLAQGVSEEFLVEVGESPCGELRDHIVQFRALQRHLEGREQRRQLRERRRSAWRLRKREMENSKQDTVYTHQCAEGRREGRLSRSCIIVHLRCDSPPRLP